MTRLATSTLLLTVLALRAGAADAVEKPRHRTIELQATIVPAAAAARAGRYRVAASSLLVRSEPNLAGAVVDALPRDAVVEGRPVPVGWLEIAPGRYVSLSFLVATESGDELGD